MFSQYQFQNEYHRWHPRLNVDKDTLIMRLEVIGFVTLAVAIAIVLKGESDKRRVLQNIQFIEYLLKSFDVIDGKKKEEQDENEHNNPSELNRDTVH